MEVEKMYLENHELVYNYLYKRTGDRGLAEDLSMDTWLRAINHSDSFDGENPKGWLIALATNVLNNYYSRETSVSSTSYLSQLRNEEGEIDIMDLADYGADPEQIHLEEERKAEARTTLGELADSLTDREARIVELYHLAGLSCAAIAERVGTSLTNVTSTLSRARKKMREDR